MDADGRHLRSLPSGADDDLFPIWTPDGTRLVVAASSFLGTPSGSLLNVIDADGSRRSVVPGVDNAQDPAWRP